MLSYDEMKTDPEKMQWRIQHFLGREFPGQLGVLNTHESPDKVREIPPSAQEMLEPYYRDKNVELYEFLDSNPGPWMEQHPFLRFNEMPKNSWNQFAPFWPEEPALWWWCLRSWQMPQEDSWAISICTQQASKTPHQKQ